MYLSYFGIRVTNLDRSLKFYTELFGLKEVARGDNRKLGGGIYVLLRDEKSGQKLELNSYPESSPYGVPYFPGEGLDHVAFKVNDVTETVKQLVANGAEPVEILPSLAEVYREKYGGSYKLAYVKDPDGNWIELYQHPQPIGPTIPEAY